MNIKTIKNPHLLLELFLCFIVVYLFAQKSETLLVNNTPFPQDTILNFALLKDNTVALVDGNGKPVNDVNGKPVISQKEKKLHSIAIVDGGVEDYHITDSLLDMVIKPAYAHRRKVEAWVDGQYVCYYKNDMHSC